MWGCRKSWRAQQAATGAAGTACPGCCCCCISACTSDWNSLRMQRTNALKLPPPLSCSKSRCSPGTAGSHACTATAAGACQRQVEHKGSWDGSCTEQVHTSSKLCHNHSSHSKVARRHCPSMQPVVHTCPAKSSLLTCIRVVAHHLNRKLEGAGVVPRVQLRIKSGTSGGRRYTQCDARGDRQATAACWQASRRHWACSTKRCLPATTSCARHAMSAAAYASSALAERRQTCVKMQRSCSPSPAGSRVVCSGAFAVRSLQQIWCSCAAWLQPGREQVGRACTETTPQPAQAPLPAQAAHAAPTPVRASISSTAVAQQQAAHRAQTQGQGGSGTWPAPGAARPACAP